ncbi:branched-chain amino acid transport system II carrier protein [Natranaerobius thermophilus]|uniref:Branched-chain amino acid transport system carrier protein n=1 Tax=Natranaerobius thermophilus (strain ATCC BAA-1301 / DSM 18059 / JW/NM-WN-LF) TaxID=457570 RepID=B2A137_NATTJ|nr:branched-chain amino acid transport system II carrier protein [Natranaerobius thermophilus]ACB84660.1 branched-chain amino acid transport system II carrier protein [Natranaerobius thermophilus JW/NM-WN-LF]
MNKKYTDTVVVGFALFAMFLGAGNVIFPPFLGHSSGTDWLPALIGFLLTGVGLPLLGIIAVAVAGGTVDHLAKNVSKNFGKLFGSVIVLTIGPLLAIPRTGATAFELGIAPFLEETIITSIIATTIFFGITLYFSLNPSTVIDRIGKYLTPTLVAVLGIIVIVGFISPVGAPQDVSSENTFTIGFTEGYQTMDALASILFAGIVIGSLIDRGYKTVSDQISLTIRAGAIAATGLGLIYGGLVYLGSTASGVFDAGIHRTDLLIGISGNLLGSLGTAILGISVFLACLTTSIGLTTTVGKYFNDLSEGKLKYNHLVIGTVLFSLFFANAGVELIVTIAEPILITIYPTAIVLIIMSLFDKYINDKIAYRGAVVATFLIGLMDAFRTLDLNPKTIEIFMSNLPLAEYGMPWITPAIVCAILASVAKKLTSENMF